MREREIRHSAFRVLPGTDSSSSHALIARPKKWPKGQSPMTTLRTGIRILIATLPVTLLFASRPLEAQTAPKPATEATKAANRALQQYLNFNDREDFENATRGFIGKPEALTIKDAKGNVVWDLETVQDLHRHRQAGARHRQSEPVAQRPAQHAVRALQGAPTASTRCAATTSPTSPSSKGDTGWIVFDPLISAETAKAAYDLVYAAPRPAAGRRRGLQPFARRPLRRRARHRRRSRRQGRQGADPRAGTFHGACHQRERHRRQRHEPPRDLHVRRPAAAQPATGGVNGGLGQTTSTGTADLDRADPRDQEDRRGGRRSTACRWCSR